MAYNNREWDRGKDSSAQSGWQQNTRQREDDHYGEGKRRKFNAGGYQAYDNSQSYEDSGYDMGYGQGHAQGFQYRGPGGNKKPQRPSDPSPHVIFLGLDPDFTEADLQAFLSGHGCSIETVTIIRASKGFGFAQFASSEHAQAFVAPQFPYINVPPPASHGHTAAAAFYKHLKEGTPHNGRRVKIDYSQSATPHEKGRFNRGNQNDGTRDIGNSQTAVLLFRGLDPLSGPQAIHQAMRSSAGPGKDGGKGMKRIILIKDRVTMASFGFAFVEFVDIQSASTVLANSMSPQIHPAGFRISDRPVAVSFANPESFQPIAEIMLRDETCLTSSLALGGVEGTYVRYWDESSTVAVLEFQVTQLAQSATAAPAKEKKEKKKKVEPALKPIIQAPSTLPVSDKPVTLNFKSTNKAGAATGIKPLALGFSADDTNEEENEGDTANGDKSKSTSKNVAPLIASKKTANNISKWNQVQEELSSTGPVAGPSTLQAMPNESPAPSITATKSQSPIAENEFEFSDVASMSCLLCARQFKSKNYKDPNLREVAKQKLAVRQATNAKPEQPKYRDRASERRTLFNQPDIPILEADNGKAGKRRQADGPSPPPSPPPAPLNPGQDENNMGNKLLKMMGWKEGTGLGIAGDGRVEPIKTAIYAEGVGLGASKGKEIEKISSTGGGYLAMAQESARERYGQ
ncbi:rna-directed rna polymerase 2 [Moniliophthora roreri]|nr:rna-directed rna polymerase 2 [Moniliophthora roreri]